MAVSDVMPVRSDRCGLDELFVAWQAGEAQRSRLGLEAGWPCRWTASWRTADGDLACAVRDLAEVSMAGLVPVRPFSWRRRQRHRPGLQFMVSTGRLHGFESLEERALLLALDFTGTLLEVLSQPFGLKFETDDGETGRHIPDYLAVLRDGSWWLIDVRPASLVEDEDAVRFAAAAEAALEAGWRYSVVAGWRPHVLTDRCRPQIRARPARGDAIPGDGRPYRNNAAGFAALRAYLLTLAGVERHQHGQGQGPGRQQDGAAAMGRRATGTVMPDLRRYPVLQETEGHVHCPSVATVKPQLLPLPLGVASITYWLGHVALTFQVE